MLRITDTLNDTTREFATRDGENATALFKITEREKAVLYWIDETHGVYLWRPANIWGKFNKLENGRIFAQYTLDKINLD